MKVRKIVLTGATGMVGWGIFQKLSEREDLSLKLPARRALEPFKNDFVKIDGIGPNTDWSSSLEGVDVVIHAAARVHVMNETSSNPLAEFREINVKGTLNLARQAAGAGTKRFVFISSIAVNGKRTLPGKPFTAEDAPNPHNDYGVSKFEAEEALKMLGEETGMEIVIIRPPLVYGPGVKAKFLKLLKVVRLSFPLPLGGISNKKSFVSLDNLVDLVITCIDHPAAADQTFLVSDGEDVSTPELLRKLSYQMNKRAWLISVPIPILTAVAKLLGKEDILVNLCESLQLDNSKAERLLGWRPMKSMDEGLKKTVQDFEKSLERNG